MAEKVNYRLRVSELSPEKRSRLEKMLPSRASVDSSTITNQIYYTFVDPLSERQILKIVKIAENLNVPYEFKKF